MTILTGLDGLRALPAGAVVSIGNFDGIHRGHTAILELGRRLRAEGASALAVVTFEPHPLTVLRPQLAPPRLTPEHLKRELLEQAGVDCLVVLPPDESVLNTPAEEFWRILKDESRVAHLIEGPAFNFGKNRGGSTQKLLEWSADTNVTVHVVGPVQVALLDLSIVEVSSSIIRWLIGNGRVRDAAICLGRPYVLEGKVVRGYQRGADLGFATANLDCGDQFLPADGVYAGRTTIDGATWPAAVSIGVLPTFEPAQRQVEAHLVGFAGDLYGRTIEVELVDWIRDQRRFPEVESLQRQVQVDIDLVVERQEMDPARQIAKVG